ncbi:gamma-glutamyl-gamma-aminobutyrate hydrolase family protein [Candidatus Micrarchaeota archaeon]|nr:gamma-glutamyl-gamma-aminobutyrate hydrolase family protein [Candidatus Micrarchaeota archaeon]
MGKILVVDCSVSERQGKLRPTIYPELTVLHLARLHRVDFDRFILVDHPNLRNCALGRVVDKRKYHKVVISGSGPIDPANDEQKIGQDVTSGELNSTVLRIIELCVERGIPLLGICYGHQMICRSAGARVEDLETYEFGFVPVQLTQNSQEHPLFAGIDSPFLAAEHHNMGVRKPSGSLDVLAQNDRCVQAVQIRGTEVTGVQFHPDFNSGHGVLEDTVAYYYRREAASLRLSEAPLVEPPDKDEAYMMNNVPLLRFMRTTVGSS